jgi:hypothetical protein
MLNEKFLSNACQKYWNISMTKIDHTGIHQRWNYHINNTTGEVDY